MDSLSKTPTFLLQSPLPLSLLLLLLLFILLGLKPRFQFPLLCNSNTIFQYSIFNAVDDEPLLMCLTLLIDYDFVTLWHFSTL
ncbi:hypothetical protein LOK49_LG04G01349 [Camellia lanceoleosa]|uniref:Uncharacterized protein n=1 Tax=Camellia lanceoleosa TaxID=1840588 RepID=A0ACC0HVI0_9ERIC|nr:hypothetical protein LOK49_LG04G01349 [Camellia lanceoleosa]